MPRGWPDLGAGQPWLRVDSERDATIMVGSPEFRRVQSNCWDADERLADMDADGVDVQVVSPTPVFFSYDAPGKQAARSPGSSTTSPSRSAPRARAGSSRSARFRCRTQTPPARELDRCMAAGHLGVEIGNHVGDRDLDDAGIVTFLQHAADAGRPRCSCTRGTCRPRPGSTGGWPGG